MMRILLGFFLWCSTLTSLFAQIQRTPTKQIHVNSTTDSIHPFDAKEGQMFLAIKSYFEEYSTVKPGSETQLYWIGEDKQGDFEVRYVFTNYLIDFHVETRLIYPKGETYRLDLNVGRRVPVLVQFNLVKEGELLRVDLL